jgi:hypothetical protein
VILRRSQDQGKSWSPKIPYFDTSKPDPTLALSPKGDLLIEFVKQDPGGNFGAAYSRSTDYGITWAPFQFFDQPVSNTSAFSAFINVGTTIYAPSYGPSTVGSAFLHSSGSPTTMASPGKSCPNSASKETLVLTRRQ